MKYAIVYSSKTGNTKMLAERLQEVLPKQDCIYCGVPDEMAMSAERLYVGFWCDKGTCDRETEAFLKKVRDKEVYLFGTAGFGGEKAYFDKILKRVQENLNKDVNVIGTFMCQGKMPMSVRERYEKMLKAPDHKPNVEMLIKNFDAALSHPNEEDLEKLEADVKEYMKKYKIKRIDEPDFGCEGRADGMSVMDQVTLVDENDRELVVEVADALLYQYNLNEGDLVFYGEESGIKKACF